MQGMPSFILDWMTLAKSGKKFDSKNPGKE